MHNLDQVGSLNSDALARQHAKQATVETDYSALSVMHHLARAIIGWLTIIIVIQLVVKHFDWS
jgi:hypothetical protein